MHATKNVRLDWSVLAGDNYIVFTASHVLHELASNFWRKKLVQVVQDSWVCVRGASINNWSALKSLPMKTWKVQPLLQQVSGRLTKEYNQSY